MASRYRISEIVARWRPEKPKIGSNRREWKCTFRLRPKLLKTWWGPSSRFASSCCCWTCERRKKVFSWMVKIRKKTQIHVVDGVLILSSIQNKDISYWSIIRTRCSLLPASYSQKERLCVVGRSRVMAWSRLILQTSTIVLFFGGCWWPWSRSSLLVFSASWSEPSRCPPKGHFHSICSSMHRLPLSLMSFFVSPPKWPRRRCCDP